MSDINKQRKIKKLQKRKRELIRRKNQRRAFIMMGLSLVIIGWFSFYFIKANHKKSKIQIVKTEEKNNNIKRELKKSEVLISIAGDCTLGTDEKLGYANSLPAAFDNNEKDYSYFMQNVFDIFNQDDYTLVNLETTFTDSEIKAPKGGKIFFNFKGPKEYVNILSSSSIEGVTISNNHIYDYGTKGINDTVETLKSKNIGICGEGYKIIKEIKGVKLGFLGYMGWEVSDELKDKISTDITELRNQGVDIIIPYFHWGSESQYKPDDNQIELARFAIDNGANAVIGSHAHVIQTIENYKGKLIAYSMGNFCFGGNFNPRDKRTFILQMKINFEDDKLIKSEYKVIPTMISSKSYKNDYIPTIAIDNRIGILNKLNELSPTLNGKITDEFFTIEK